MFLFVLLHRLPDDVPAPLFVLDFFRLRDDRLQVAGISGQLVLLRDFSDKLFDILFQKELWILLLEIFIDVVLVAEALESSVQLPNTILFSRGDKRLVLLPLLKLFGRCQLLSTGPATK